MKIGTINTNTGRRSTMNYAIIGFGLVGQALATMFARKGIEVAVASRRSPEALASQASEIGPQVVPKSLDKALEADIIFLAVPFWEHRVVAKARANWQDKTVIDVTNAYSVPVEDLGGLPSSAVVARALPGARLVKAFNHLPAATLAADPAIRGGRRVIFVSSDDDAAASPAAARKGTSSGPSRRSARKNAPPHDGCCLQRKRNAGRRHKLPRQTSRPTPKGISLATGRFLLRSHQHYAGAPWPNLSPPRTPDEHSRRCWPIADLPDFEALEDAGLLSKEKLLAGDIMPELSGGEAQGAGIEIED